MRWKDKLKPWSRYVHPVGQTATARDDVLKHLLEATSLPVSTTFKAKKESELAVTTASFGHVLHGKSSRTAAAMAKHRRLLSPVLPHPASFTSIMDEDKPLTQRTTITLNFSPTPSIIPKTQAQRSPASNCSYLLIPSPTLPTLLSPLVRLSLALPHIPSATSYYPAKA